MTNAKEPKSQNIINRMHPVTRVGISLAAAGILFFLFPREKMSALLLIMGLWVVFSFSYVLTSWIILFTRPEQEIRKAAISDDGSSAYVLIMILVTSFASMFAILLLMINKTEQNASHGFFIPVILGGMVLSWIMVHTIFTFHYAHMYYARGEDEKQAAGGLNFPGNQRLDYIDFAYLSFVIGCTFQVSDVQVTSKRIRRVVMMHGLLSFALNTIVIALTINFIAGLKSG